MPQFSLTSLRQAFTEHYQHDPSLIVRAPGRVNLIGEHTDYNDGFVLPLAIDRAVWIALSPQRDNEVEVHSLDLEASKRFSLDTLKNTDEGWLEYLKGIAWALQQAGHTLTGWRGVMTGNVPRGAGLSSSAALELATAKAFAEISGLPWNPQEMAKLAQKAENQWVGVNCGIMDQLISATGEAGHAVLIDCRSLEPKPVPLPPETAVVILDTATRRGLVDSAYNERRQQCEKAAAHFGVAALRDVTLEQFSEGETGLDTVTCQRARHVISENTRTLKAADVMHRGDAQALGQLMNESHESLKDDFEVSSDALNTIVTCARKHPACYGARMTGAGFGGCAVALIRQAEAEAFVEHVRECYQIATDKTPNVYVCQASNGAEVVWRA